MPENTAPVNSLPRWTPSVEERKIARRDAIPIAVYLESTDHETADWIGEFEQAIKYGGSILMSKQFCSAVTSLLVSALKHGHAVLLEDEASFACSLFLGIGADRQSLMLPAIEGCGHDRDKYFDREHPEKDPYVGLNERLTAGRNPSRQAAS